MNSIALKTTAPKLHAIQKYANALYSSTEELVRNINIETASVCEHAVNSEVIGIANRIAILQNELLEISKRTTLLEGETPNLLLHPKPLKQTAVHALVRSGDNVLLKKLYFPRAVDPVRGLEAEGMTVAFPSNIIRTIVILAKYSKVSAAKVPEELLDAVLSLDCIQKFLCVETLIAKSIKELKVDTRSVQGQARAAHIISRGMVEILLAVKDASARKMLIEKMADFLKYYNTLTPLNEVLLTFTLEVDGTQDSTIPELLIGIIRSEELIGREEPSVIKDYLEELKTVKLSYEKRSLIFNGDCFESLSMLNADSIYTVEERTAQILTLIEKILDTSKPTPGSFSLLGALFEDLANS